MTDKIEWSFIEYALKIGAIEFPPSGYELNRGRISPYFFNSGRFCTGPSLLVLANTYVDRIIESGTIPDVVFGPAYKGIPLASTVAAILAQRLNVAVGYAFNRKESKEHGEGGEIVGARLSEKKVIVLDDVMTTGYTGVDAMHHVTGVGGNVIGHLVAFDRQEAVNDRETAATAFTRNTGIPVRASANLEDLLEVLRCTHTAALPAVEAYAEQYCILS